MVVFWWRTSAQAPRVLEACGNGQPAHVLERALRVKSLASIAFAIVIAVPGLRSSSDILRDGEC
jgi:hypothetical protein